MSSTIVLAPVSPAIAALLHQLQAQIIKEAEELQAPAVGFDSRPPLPYFTDHGDADFVRYFDGKGNTDDFRRRRFCPESWADGSVPWHPSHWRLYQTRVDNEGAHWSSAGRSQIHVIDDFGYLVPLGEALQ